MTTVAGNKRRGWVAIFAGLFIIVLIGCCWAYVAYLLGRHGTLQSPSDAQFLGRTYVAFALVMISGILGTINGVYMVRTGNRNRPLTFATMVSFVAALITVAVGGGR